jgi:hypothetical protein
MSTKPLSTQVGHAPLKAVCFDFSGVIIDHRSENALIPGVEALLGKLIRAGVKLAIASRFPVDAVVERLGGMQRYFGGRIFSGGGGGKLDCIKTFADQCGILDLSWIAFVDDKADNLLPVAQNSSVHVVGFRGSGKYPHTREVCKRHGIAFAEDVRELENHLLALLHGREAGENQKGGQVAMKMNETVKKAQELLIELVRANRITFLMPQPDKRTDKQLFVTDFVVNDNQGREDLQISLSEAPLTRAELEAVLERKK